MEFNESYYKKIILENNYNPIDFSSFENDLLGISKQQMKSKWLCHSGLDNIKSTNDTIITTGVGISGPPHMGTLSQIMRIIFLQKNGFNTQIVLGDLDSYNARNKTLSYVSNLSDQYYEFILKLGYDPNKGIIRKQNDNFEINYFSYLLSKYLTDEDFYATKEDLCELYQKEKIYTGITFPIKQSILLMISDFLCLGQKYNNIVVMLGLEEHKYVLLARKLRDRINANCNIYSLYSRIIKGFNGYPKMSKSIKKSNINVDMSYNDVRKMIISENDDYKSPLDSVIFQMMTSVSDYSSDELNDIYSHCLCKDKGWMDYKENYALKLSEYLIKWNS